jgi:hypothetical protein
LDERHGASLNIARELLLFHGERLIFRPILGVWAKVGALPVENGLDAKEFGAKPRLILSKAGPVPIRSRNQPRGCTTLLGTLFWVL